MKQTSIEIQGRTIPAYEIDTVVVGSGAASLNCADHLHAFGKKDIAMVTEKIGGGTSNNAGSDKQTYYKLSLSGKELDSAFEMAKSLYDGGGMHGDLALIEATMSAQEFFHLVQIGVPFPHDAFGGFVGYKTDHDPRQRATSAGPWTSHQMVQNLLREVRAKNIPIFDDHEVIALIVEDGQAVGFLAIDKNKMAEPHHGLVIFLTKNTVFGVGGPGGLYKTSVYPESQIGAIGLALEVGAVARNLTESQYGLASIKFRWNVSGTYQQVIPRYFSTDEGGKDEQEFLNTYFPSMGKLATDIFLKGYQWPFDPRKIPDYGSSLIDVLVYIETVVKGRHVYMDFRENPRGDDRIGAFSFEALEPEAYNYLKNSDALLKTPIERLEKMNPLAIELYAKNGIDIKKEPLEVAVCAQHNNGGLAADIWWESNIRNFFPIGEVNGTHGVYRPGGSALNAGQVGSLRAALRIARGGAGHCVPEEKVYRAVKKRGGEMLELIERLLANSRAKITVAQYRREFQQRMTNFGSHIRQKEKVDEALKEAYEQIERFEEQSISCQDELPTILQNRHLVLAQAAYLEAIRAYLEKGGGSRGSYLVMEQTGTPVLESLGDAWRYKPENPVLRYFVLETVLGTDGRFHSQWKKRRPIPQEESWFESVWGQYLNGEIFNKRSDI